jgi:hypothetical protein
VAPSVLLVLFLRVGSPPLFVTVDQHQESGHVPPSLHWGVLTYRCSGLSQIDRTTSVTSGSRPSRAPRSGGLSSTTADEISVHPVKEPSQREKMTLGRPRQLEPYMLPLEGQD